MTSATTRPDYPAAPEPSPAGRAGLLENVQLERPCPFPLPEVVVGPGEHPGHDQRLESVAGVMEETRALFPVVSRRLVVLCVGGRMAEHQQRGGAARAVSELPVQGQRFLASEPRRG